MIVAAITAMGVIGSAYLTSRVSNRKLRADGPHQLVDQLQEEVATLRREVAETRKTQRIQGDYIGQLRRHIADGNPPPPPSFPEGLIT